MSDSEWQVTTLGDEIDILTGFPFKSASYSSDARDIPLLRGDNIVQGHFRWDDVRRWPLSLVAGVKIYFLSKGDVVVAMDRPWIEAGLKYAHVSTYDLPCLLVQRVARLRARRGFDPGFLRYLIGSPKFTSHVLSIQTGTTVPHISAAQIKDFHFSRPPLPEQRAIAAILGALDDKIELNRRMNETLEAIARTLFTSWFVDFDPVRAKMEGREPAGMDAETAAPFPDAFEDSVLGNLPQGWHVGPFASLAALTRTVINPSDYPDEVFDHYSIPAYDQGQIPTSDQGSTIKSQKFVVPANSLLLSKLNPRFPRVWIPTINPIQRAIASTEFLVLLPQHGTPRVYLYDLCLSSEFMKAFASRVTGTSSSHQRVKPEDLLSMTVVLPPETVRVSFAKQVEPLLQRTHANRQESRILAAIRDALLPKLLSGEVRVREAERLVEAVV